MSNLSGARPEPVDLGPATHSFGTKPSSMLLLAGLLVLASVMLLRAKGTGDVEIWKRWAENALRAGPVAGFALNAGDYPPLCTLVLYVVAKLGQLAGVSTFVAIKWSLWTTLTVSSLIAGVLTRSWAVGLLLQAGLLLNSVALGYVDIYFAPPLLLGMLLLERQRLVAASFALALACSTKWQPLILMPFIAVHVLHVRTLRELWSARPAITLLRFLMPFLGTCAVIVLAFGVDPVVAAFRISLDHKFLSGNALNFNWLITHYLHVFEPEYFGPLVKGHASYIITDEGRLTTVPKLLFKLFYGVALFAWFRAEKTFEGLLAYALLGFLAYFTWNTGVHENHLFTVCLLAVLWFRSNPAQWPVQACLVLMANVNLYAFYGATGKLTHSRVVASLDLAVVLALFFVVFFLVLWAQLVFGRWVSNAPPRPVER